MILNPWSYDEGCLWFTVPWRGWLLTLLFSWRPENWVFGKYVGSFALGPIEFIWYREDWR